MTETNTALSACTECGMPCAPAEYHPYAACLMFKGCHNSETVRSNLSAPIAPEGREALTWYEGEPPKPWRDEWFIAQLTKGGGKVVLRALPKEFSYDYRTADETYYMADRIKRWMQFPDSEYVTAPAPQAAAPAPAGMVLVPKRLTRAMQEVLGDEWDWPDLLAAAEVITEEEEQQLNELGPLAARAPSAAAGGQGEAI